MALQGCTKAHVIVFHVSAPTDFTHKEYMERITDNKMIQIE